MFPASARCAPQVEGPAQEGSIPALSRVSVRECPDGRRVDILKVPSVASIVGLNGHPLPIPAEQVDSVKRLVFSTLPYDPYPYLVEGDRVEITRGALKGLRGVLLEKRADTASSSQWI